jgi:hypothetical protein
MAGLLSSTSAALDARRGVIPFTFGFIIGPAPEWFRDASEGYIGTKKGG